MSACEAGTWQVVTYACIPVTSPSFSVDVTGECISESYRATIPLALYTMSQSMIGKAVQLHIS